MTNSKRKEKIIIDLISSFKITNKGAFFTGGTNYALAITREILCDDFFISRADITVLLPNSIKINSLSVIAKGIKNAKIIYENKLENINYSTFDKLFLPQVNGTVLQKVYKIHKKFNKVLIYGVLHDRQHNFLNFDNTVYYYSKKRISNYLKKRLLYKLKKIYFDFNYNKWIKSFTKVFTVSNYSMQKLLNKNVRDIKYYIQPNIFDEQIKVNNKGNYILFVGGNRPEKNLFRTLEAYCKYIENSSQKYRLKITGINNTLKYLFLKNSKLNSVILESYVDFLPYVSYEKLVNLYKDCRYVLFLSVGEGYGLPIREAMSFGKTVLASRVTSIPEVAGAALKYINPFDVNSIIEGMLYFDKEENLSRYTHYVSKREKIVEELSSQDIKILLSDLLE